MAVGHCGVLEMPRWLNYILAAVIGWLVFFGLSAAQHVLGGAFTWEQAVRVALYEWLPWTIVSPLILWLTLQYPMGRDRWAARVLVHLAAAALAVMLCAWLSDILIAPPSPDFGRGSDHFGDRRPPPFEMDQHPAGDEGPPNFHRMGPPPFWFRARFNIPIYLTFASLSHAIVYFRRSQQRGRRTLELEAQLSEARLQALRMQLHPHFLFNTLNAISTLVHTNPDSADEMIASLSYMLRLALDTVMEQEVPLSQELKYFECYLDIEQIRFGNRLVVKRDIGPDLQAALVPTFILQPLVENAIKHGIERNPAQGTIEVSAQKAGEVLRLSIRDTGVGLSAAGEGIEPKGIGLSNTRARLQTLYPGRHRFVLRNGAGSGCIAEVEIPFHAETWLTTPRPKES